MDEQHWHHQSHLLEMQTLQSLPTLNELEYTLNKCPM